MCMCFFQYSRWERQLWGFGQKVLTGIFLSKLPLLGRGQRRKFRESIALSKLIIYGPCIENSMIFNEYLTLLHLCFQLGCRVGFLQPFSLSLLSCIYLLLMISVIYFWTIRQLLLSQVSQSCSHVDGTNQVRFGRPEKE